MANDDSSELSSLSSLSEPPSEDESGIQLERQHGILKFFHKVDANPELEPEEPSPPRPKREPSPPHDYVLADRSDIAVCVLLSLLPSPSLIRRVQGLEIREKSRCERSQDVLTFFHLSCPF